MTTTWLLSVERLKARVKAVYRRSYKRFANEQFVEDVRNMDWNGVYSADDPEVSFIVFMNIFMGIVNKHAQRTHENVHSGNKKQNID